MSNSREKRLSAVLLAAGESRRMGSINKLALSVGGEPVLRHTARILAQSDLAELVVVVGYEQAVARTLLQGIAVRIVYNEHFSEGQMTSVHCGLNALTAPCAGIMICLSDQVLLEVDDIHTIATGFARCPTSIMIPCYQGQRGNPLVIDYSHRETILADGMNLGCKRLVEKNPELLTVLEMPNDHVLVDMDTPRAHEMLEQRISATNAASENMTNWDTQVNAK